MEIVKIRRVGNSNVVSLPKALEQQGYVPGVQVVVDVLPSGDLVLQPVARLPDAKAKCHHIGDNEFDAASRRLS